MGDKLFFITIGVILSICATLMILNFVWLFPVMINSKKEEPLVEIGSILSPNYDTLDLDNLKSSKSDCEKNIYDIDKEGVYETFNFKMKEIHAYSTGLVAILFIQIGLFIILLFIICIFSTGSVRAYAELLGCIFITHIIMTVIISLLNLTFFILLLVYFYKGKIDEFKDFSECSFFDETNFNKTFGYIFSVYKNCQRVFIANILFLFFTNFPGFFKIYLSYSS